MFAKHNIYSALYAFATGKVNDISAKTIKKGLSNYRPSGFRQNIYKSGKITIYADCYNAVAKSVKSAIDAADSIPTKGRRIAVLGDVAEAGLLTKSTHTEIVKIVNDSDFDALFSCSNELKNAISNSRIRDTLSVYLYDSQNEMNRSLKRFVKNYDLILFKSSHSGNLQNSIKRVFPYAYCYQMLKYYIPRIIWHFKVILG